MSEMNNTGAVASLDDAQIGTWYLRTMPDGCKVPYVKLCKGTEQDWFPLQPHTTLINDPVKSCVPTLECGVLNLPCVDIWRKNSVDLGTQIVPRNIMSPLVMDETKVDTAQKGGHGDGVKLPCPGKWMIESSITVVHPLEEGAAKLSPDALFGLFVSLNGAGAPNNPSFLRQYSNTFTAFGLYYVNIYVQREIWLNDCDTFTPYLFWEDPLLDEVQSVSVQSISMKARKVCDMPSTGSGGTYVLV